MKTAIEVKDRAEALLIRTALKDPETRAVVKTMGTLLPLKDPDARRLVLIEAARRLKSTMK